ncbi:unnamed protein product [Heligmosomoides polygyrus]|uniref:Neurotransmitter-gated ion-channel ligand-binding domain-containing protein n=1 Tax=Heligmosomoides polygyrus TaxID=6339 RepID=A0A3P7Z8T1_HELPZ|nr:unnamed protein product [Heligmosomoides polygyrus]
MLYHLMKDYEKAVRPVRNASHTVTVRLGMTMTNIFDMDERNQVLTINVWLDQNLKQAFIEGNRYLSRRRTAGLRDPRATARACTGTEETCSTGVTMASVIFPREHPRNVRGPGVHCGRRAWRGAVIGQGNDDVSQSFLRFVTIPPLWISWMQLGCVFGIRN